MRQRVTLIFQQNDRILVMFRNRFGQIYYIIPGGGVEPSESLTEAAYREAYEETSLNITLGIKISEQPMYGQQTHTFLVTAFSGKMAVGGPEGTRQAPDNIYQLIWVPLNDLPEPLYFLDEAVLAMLREGMQ